MIKKLMVFAVVLMIGLVVVIKIELDQLSKEKIVCEFDGKGYRRGEAFLISLETGCSVCYCNASGDQICGKKDCPQGVLK